MSTRQIQHFAQDSAAVVGILLYLAVVFACLTAVLIGFVAQ